MPNEKRLRANSIGGLIEDNPLTNVATTLTSAGLAALPVIDTTNHAAIVLDPDGYGGAPEIVYVTTHANAGTVATILRGQEGTAAREHIRDMPWIHAPTKRDFAVGRVGLAARTGGNLTLNSTAWANVDTALDLTLIAQVGDVVECAVAAYFGEAEAVSGSLDFWTVVSGAAVNPVGSDGTTTGYATAWIVPSSVKHLLSGSMMRILDATDISATGTVTLRLRYRTDGAANKVVRATVAMPLKVWAKNLGPQES